MGSSDEFRCANNFRSCQDINWLKYDAKNNDQLAVSSGSTVENVYTARHSLIVSDNGECTLRINNLTMSDATTFVCRQQIDENTRFEKRAELILGNVIQSSFLESKNLIFKTATSTNVNVLFGYDSIFMCRFILFLFQCPLISEYLVKFHFYFDFCIYYYVSIANILLSLLRFITKSSRWLQYVQYGLL